MLVSFDYQIVMITIIIIHSSLLYRLHIGIVLIILKLYFYITYTSKSSIKKSVLVKEVEISSDVI